MYVCMHGRKYVCIYVCVYVSMPKMLVHICMYIYIYIYIHIYIYLFIHSECPRKHFSRSLSLSLVPVASALTEHKSSGCHQQ